MSAPEAPVYYQGVARTSSAFRLLKQMGWEEGEGLGKDKQGITEHVKVKKKSDNAGVGVDAQLKTTSNWTFNTTVFDNILKNLKVQVADTIGRESEKEKLVMDDVTEENLLYKKVSRPQGRYKKRENGKLVRGYSRTDLDAILGNSRKNLTDVSFNDGPSNNPDVSAQERAPSISVDMSSQLTEESFWTCTAERESCLDAKDASLQMPDSVLAIEWWGTKHGFVRGGMLGASRVQTLISNEDARGEVAAVEQPASRSAFCEQDQENLYKLVQGKMTTGRQGLGICERTRKIGGAHWKGQKIILDNNDDMDDTSVKQQALSFAEQSMPVLEKCCTDTESCKVKEGRKITESISEEERGSKPKRKGVNEHTEFQMQIAEEHEVKRKWRKQCVRVLEEVPSHKMSIKRLHKRVVGVYELLPVNSAGDSEATLVHFKRRLERSPKFIIKGKKVSLAGSKEQE